MTCTVSSWQKKLDEAESALAGGRVEDARRMLSDTNVRRSPAGQALAGRLVQHYTQRAKQFDLRGDTSAGWRNLHQAQVLAGDSQSVAAIREEFVKRAVHDVERLLEAGNPDAALAKLDRLHGRNVAGGRVAELRQVVLKARRAQRLSRVGKFDQALAELEAARRLRSDLNTLKRSQQQVIACAQSQCQLLGKLENAMAGGEWENALAAAEDLLSMAPEHPQALDARHVVWEELSKNLTDSQRRAETSPWPARLRAPRYRSQKLHSREILKVRGSNPRLLLWVDAVGGYLICLGDQVEIGQAVPGTLVDVPVLGDISRQHATVRRDGENYIIEALGPMQVEGRKTDKAVLCDGDEIQLGPSVRLRFRQPHALSATARLDFVSHHRTQPPADGVLFMAESCVLGPKLQNHIVCPQWSQDVILYRQKDEIRCRAGEEFEIDGQLCEGEGKLQPGSHASGDDFSLSIEEV